MIFKKNDIIVVQKEYVLTNNELQRPFDYDFNLSSSFFIKELNKILLN